MTLLRQQLLAQAELFDQRLIAGAVGVFQIREQCPTVVNHPEQTAAAVVIFSVNFEVVAGQKVNVGGQQCDLHFGRAGIVR